jgi:hypothetical protein
MSGYAQEPMSGYAEPVAYYAEEPPMGYYAEEPPMGYYAEEPPMGYYAEEPPMGYYADEQTVGYCSDGYYADVPELVGWGDQETPMGYYGDDPFAGYVRAGRPQFNPGCPMPTNVAGYEDSPLEGYARPRTVNAMCESFKPQPDTTGELPETFKPIW